MSWSSSTTSTVFTGGFADGFRSNIVVSSLLWSILQAILYFSRPQKKKGVKCCHLSYHDRPSLAVGRDLHLCVAHRFCQIITPLLLRCHLLKNSHCSRWGVAVGNRLAEGGRRGRELRQERYSRNDA